MRWLNSYISSQKTTDCTFPLPKLIVLDDPVLVTSAYKELYLPCACSRMGDSRLMRHNASGERVGRITAMRYADHGVGIFVNPCGWEVLYSIKEVASEFEISEKTSKILWQFLKRLTPNLVNTAAIERWGFLDAIDDVDECSEDIEEDWMILRVVLGNGEQNDWEANQYYASDREKGVPETF